MGSNFLLVRGDRHCSDPIKAGHLAGEGLVVGYALPFVKVTHDVGMELLETHVHEGVYVIEVVSGLNHVRLTLPK